LNHKIDHDIIGGYGGHDWATWRHLLYLAFSAKSLAQELTFKNNLRTKNITFLIIQFVLFVSGQRLAQQPEPVKVDGGFSSLKKCEVEADKLPAVRGLHGLFMTIGDSGDQYKLYENGKFNDILSS